MAGSLWNIETEKDFFIKAITGGFASVKDLFYKFNKDFYAYIKNDQENNGQTLQSRNSLIGNYTETWCENLLAPFARKMNLFAIKDVVCPEIGLSKQSSADVAICTKNSKEQDAENIKLIIEVKMSIVNNYQYINKRNITYIGDYKSHKGNPSLLRSDSMLKAIGKSINIRVSGFSSATIPIIIIGNSPITKSYVDKVDFLKKAGVIQGFFSINPDPTESDHIIETENKGFQTINDLRSFEQIIEDIIQTQMNYFSSMISRHCLGEIIKVASQEKNNIDKAEKFLELIRK